MSKALEAYRRLCRHLDYDNDDYMFNGGYEEDNEVIENALKDYETIKKDLERVEKLEEINHEAIKIAALLKSKTGYIFSKKGSLMKLRISNITYSCNKYMVNGYCIDSDNCRVLPLNKVYLIDEVLEND